LIDNFRFLPDGFPKKERIDIYRERTFEREKRSMKREASSSMMRTDDTAACAADRSIKEKITEAQDLFRTYEARLRGDPGLCSLLESLAGNVAATNRIMKKLEVVKACKWCEEEAGGSCCGVGIENRYSSLLLLVNLLLDVTLPQKREQADSCYFLGTGGCCLEARHVLCVNYLCRKLTEALSPEDLNVLQAAAGVELDTGFFVYEAVNEIIRD